jgi:SAM-dependent methyltransferase
MDLLDTLAVLRTAGLSGTRRLKANASAMKRWVRPYAVTTCLLSLEKNGLNQELLAADGIDIARRSDLDHTTLTTVLEYLFENDLLSRSAGVYRAKDPHQFTYALEAMYAVYAYHEPAAAIDRMLRGEVRYGRDVVRSDEYDAIASATLNSKFSFQFTNRVLQRAGASSLMDMGCGTGEFLAYLAANGFGGKLYGVDLAADAIEAGKARGFQSDKVSLFTGDLLALGESARANGLETVDVLSLMFVLHEFDDAMVPRILQSAAETFPQAQILLTELIDRDSEVLRRTRAATVFPELKLVHRLSDQVLRTVARWDEVFADAGYRPRSKRKNNRANVVCVLYERA